MIPEKKWQQLWDLPSRDAATGLHTYEYWLYTLELVVGRYFRHPTPISCLMVEVEGLDELSQKHSEKAADRAMSIIGQTISNNVREDDPLCRYRERCIAIALMPCSSPLAERVQQRVVNHVSNVTVKQLNREYNSHLQLRSHFATMPSHITTPNRLLLATEQGLEN